MSPEERRDIEELLPFLANETLEGEERQRVEAAVAADESLAWELDYLKAVRADVKSRDVASSPGEFGLARLMREIDAEPQKAATPQIRSNGRIWQMAAAAAVALFVAQSAFVWGPGGSGYELAGGGSGASDGPVLIVAFAEGAPESAIRQLLLTQGLEVVGGPSALGLYRVAVIDDAGAEAAIAALQAAAGVVDSVERE